MYNYVLIEFLFLKYRLKYPKDPLTLLESEVVLQQAIAQIDFATIGALITFLGVVVFMGFGFVVSGIAKSESTIPPISNIITLPQFLLSGTFFSIDVFPKWLQPISHALPLTHLNDAMRKVAFDGAGLWDVRLQILYILLWGIGVYAVAVKVFKWE